MNVIKLALEHATKIANLTSQDGVEEEEGKRGFTRRAVNFPGLTASAGLIPAVTFYMSKADNEKYRQAYNYLVHNGPKNGLEEELKREEKVGYSLYLACISDVLYKAFKEVYGNNDVNEPKDLKSLAFLLKKIEDGGKVLLIERIVEEYSLEMKKLAEALIG